MSNQINPRNASRSSIPVPAIVICSLVAVFLLIAFFGGKTNKTGLNMSPIAVTTEAYSRDSGSSYSNKGNSFASETEMVYTPSYTEINAPSLAVNTLSIEGLPSNPISVDAAEILNYDGNISYEDQVDDYSFVAPYDGRYRADITGLQNGVNVELYIIDDTGYSAASDTYCTNGEGTTAKGLKAGNTYVVRVKQDSGYSSYTLSIGLQKPTIDITGYTTVSDSVEFTDQRNVYSFTAPLDGRYRFELTGVQNGTDFELYLYNNLEETLASDTYCTNEEGITVKGLIAGETYQIQVRQDSGYGSYTMNIGYQKSTVDISELSSLTDSIEYTDQRNVYVFTAYVEGRYRFELSGMLSGTIVELYLFNSLGETVDSDTYCTNGEGITAKSLKAGEVYELQIRQDSGLSGYTLSIGKQKEPVEAGMNYIVNDSFEYTDQRNLYSLYIGSSGPVEISIQNMSSNMVVELYVFNDLHEDIAGDSYFTNGESVTVSNLPAGQYWIQVRQYDGGGKYSLVIE